MAHICWIQHFDDIERSYPIDRFETAGEVSRLFRRSEVVAEVAYGEIVGWVLAGPSTCGRKIDCINGATQGR